MNDISHYPSLSSHNIARERVAQAVSDLVPRALAVNTSPTNRTDITTTCQGDNYLAVVPHAQE
jgi:hypothetical protein